MRRRHTIHAGTTDPVVFLLTEEDPETGVVSPMNLTGINQLVMYFAATDGTGDVKTFSIVDNPGQVLITSALGGEVTFYPLATDLIARIYRLWIKVTAISTKLIGFPSDDYMEFVVLP